MKQKKILYMIFSSAPSSVVRAETFKGILAEKGYAVDYYYDYSKAVSGLLDKYNGKPLFIALVLALRVLHKVIQFVKRSIVLKQLSSYDAAIIIKYIDSEFLYRVRRVFSGKLLYDLDDAVWLPFFLGQTEYEKLVSNVDFVSCDNSYLMGRSLEFNKNSFVINGPAQVEIFDAVDSPQKKDSNELIIGWVGSPSTLFYLYAIYEALEKVAEKYPFVKLRLLGVGDNKQIIPQFDKIKVDLIPFYNQAKMVDVVKTFDIGLYPLFNNQLSLGRGSLKATIYMSAKVPAVCSAIGENIQIVTDGSNGMLAGTIDEWIDKISQLIESSQLRKEIANNGYEFAKDKYSLTACYNQLNNGFLSNI